MQIAHNRPSSTSPIKGGGQSANRPSGPSNRLTTLIREVRKALSGTRPAQATAAHPAPAAADQGLEPAAPTGQHTGSHGTRKGLSPGVRTEESAPSAPPVRHARLERKHAQVWTPIAPSATPVDAPQGPELLAHLETLRQSQYQAFAVSARVQQALAPSVAYSSICRTTVITDVGQLDGAAGQAASQATAALMPHVFKTSASYAKFRQGWNKQLNEDMALLDRLPAYARAIGLKKAGLPVRLSDLMDVARFHRSEPGRVKDWLKRGFALSDLAAGARNGLHPDQLHYVTPSEDLKGMPHKARSQRLARLAAYQEALPQVKGTVFFRLARAAFEERMTPEQLSVFAEHTQVLSPSEVVAQLDQGQWLADIAGRLRRVPGYRQALPDMPSATFFRIAREAVACDLPVEHLRPMVEAGVPIHARMKPSEDLAIRFQKALKVESKALGGGASGSELRLVTLTHRDGTEERLVTKRLAMSPVEVPAGHAVAGIPFAFEAIAQRWNMELEFRNERSSTSEEKAGLQKALQDRITTALSRGDTEIRFNMKGPMAIDGGSPPAVVQLGPDQLPNLYGRDLAMRELAALMGQPGLVAGVQTAVIDGVYCEVAAFNPDMSEQVIRPTGDAVLKLDTRARQAALAAMSDTDLQALATSRGFERAERLDHNAGVRFQLPAKHKGVGYYNRFNLDDPGLRRRYNEHQVKNFLGNEADDHESNSTVGASWDHDGSFGIHTSTSYHEMPRLVSAGTWAALQQPDWTRFDGLIRPAEIDALKARHQAFIDSRPMVVQDGEWGSAAVTQAMDLDQLAAHVQAFEASWPTLQTAQERRKAADKLGDDVLSLKTPMARHAGAWFAQQSESRATGKPGTPFFDRDGWIREIEQAGQQVKR